MTSPASVVKVQFLGARRRQWSSPFSAVTVPWCLLPATEPTQLGPGHERLQVPEVPGGAQQPERYSRASGSLPFVLAVCVNTCCGVCCMGSLLSINP